MADVPIRRDPAGLFVRPAALRRHIRLLRRWGYRLVTFGALADAVSQGTATGLAALTFDDGLAGTHTITAPLLLAEQAPATVFVVSDWDGGGHPDDPSARVMTHDQVRAVAGMGLEIGSHSSAHRDLSLLSASEAEADLAHSKASLESLLQRPVSTAAYPFGRVAADTARACREAGFVAACRISGEGDWADPWNLPRQDMNSGAGLAGLWLKRDDHYEPLMRTRAGRLARSGSRRLKAVLW